MYRVVDNFLTQSIKSVHLSGGKGCNMRHTVFFYSPRMEQSVHGYLAAVLTGKNSDMQEIHPVMYLRCGYSQK
jgi:hypothetical protein